MYVTIFKTLIYFCFCVSVLNLQARAIAEEIDNAVLGGELSGSVTFGSEYVLRGVSQSDESAVVQGNLHWAHNSGTYLGIWASNVNFSDDGEASIEFDYYSGYRETFGNWTGNIMGYYRTYPGADDDLHYDFFEIESSLSYDFGFVALTGTVDYSPSNFGNSGDALYYTLGTAVPLPYDVTADAHFGRQYIDDEAAFGLPDRNYWGGRTGA